MLWATFSQDFKFNFEFDEQNAESSALFKLF